MLDIVHTAVVSVFFLSMIRFLVILLSQDWFSDYHPRQKYYFGVFAVYPSYFSAIQMQRILTASAVIVCVRGVSRKIYSLKKKTEMRWNSGEQTKPTLDAMLVTVSFHLPLPYTWACCPAIRKSKLNLQMLSTFWFAVPWKSLLSSISLMPWILMSCNFFL